MGVVREDDGWRVPDELWTKLEPLLPPRPEHPLGCHNPRTPDRQAMDGILLVLRTGMQWRALKATGVCGPSSAYRRFREWLEAGVFWEFWRQGLLMYEALGGIDWEWLAVDGAQGKAPLGGEKNRPQPHRQREKREQEKRAVRWAGRAYRARGGWRQHERPQTAAPDARVHPRAAAWFHEPTTAGPVSGCGLRL
jgi:transposase